MLNEKDAQIRFDPPTQEDDPRVCGRCRKLYDRFTILNTRTGKYHADGGYGDTACGLTATGDEFLWPI